jgi:hypothetical protein
MEVTGGWKKFHNEDLHELFLTKYDQGDQIKGEERDGTCGMKGREKENM